MTKKTVKLVGALTAGAAAIAVAATSLASNATAQPASKRQSEDHPVKVEVFAPAPGDRAGIEGAGWFVDMELDFPAGSLAPTGFSGLQLTGPGAHNNVAPFPGTFSTGQDDRMPGLVVLTSTTNSDRPGFSGPGTNLANLFNLSGVTNRDQNETELWDTWIVGAAIAGTDVNSRLTVAVVDDLNHDGIYNDAPNVVSDVNHDGHVDADDLEESGVASNIVTVPFRINGAPAS